VFQGQGRRFTGVQGQSRSGAYDAKGRACQALDRAGPAA